MTVWKHRVRAIVVGLSCWLGAVGLVAAGFVVPFLVTCRVVGDAVVSSMGPPHHDLSDIGPALIGFAVGCLAGLCAGAVGATIASVPAIALIDRSRAQQLPQGGLPT